YEPSYAQLVRILQEQIAAGKLRPGDRLSSESQLCEHHGVSRMIVRRAINILIEQGLIITRHGQGTFIKPMQFWAATFSLGQLQNLLSDERVIRIKILEASINLARGRVTHKMAIKRGQRMLFIRRLILSLDKPIMYHREYLVYDPSRPIVESELEVTSLRGLFEGTGNSFIKRSMLSIEATVLKDEEAQLLQAPVASAAFNIEHLFYDFEDRPVSWGCFICPGTNLRFTTIVGAHNRELSKV
ncbi:MAG: GntR family transcriptional regulator, partial [Dehalococcoidia bacterium]|nr:GntR family transcriptional regulator [Dehalococcoidia bacterium]